MRTRHRPRDASHVLFSNYHRQVLGLLLLKPDENFHVRELARLTGLPAGSLHRELRALTGAGLLLREPVGNQVRYRANRAHPVYEELAGLFRKTSGLAEVLREALRPLSKSIELAYVFGSVAEGKESATSDVDVFVVGSVSFAAVVKAFLGTQNRLRRSVNPVVMTRESFESKRHKRDRFVTRIHGEPKIMLIGEAE